MRLVCSEVAVEEERLDVITTDSALVGPVSAKGWVPREIKCLSRLIIEVAHLLVELEES